MSLDNESLQLYQLSLRKPCHTIKSIVGQFTSNKKIQEIVFANNSNIEVYRPDSNSGKLIKLCQQDTWAAVQLLETFRFPGSSVDLLVVTSDSGKLVVLKFESELNRFIPVVQEPHSKTGFRRTSPGEYLAVDPQNRAIMISAVERNHLCYRVTQADDLEQIALSSPLEVVSKSVITFDMIALDTGFDNPKFATIEQSYEDASGSDMLLLTYYEFDQALNHIMKRKGGKIPASANMLVPLPNSVGGGLLICCEGGFIYKREQEDLSELIPLPSRPGVETDYSILSFVVHKMKKNQFFILLQTTNGDIFKVTIESENIEDEEEDDSSVKIKEINVTYFDTIPVCHSLNILKSGFLFANTANDNKLYYQFEKLGEDVDENTVKWTQSGLIKGEGNFSPRDGEKLENLNLVDSLESLNPIIDSTLLSTNQIVTLSAPNYIKTISHGLPTSTLVASPLPIKPTDIFTTKLTKESKNDDYLVISSTLSSQTLVLSIGEVVEEVTDSQFIKDQPTITLQQIGETSVIQVHPNGIRYVNTATKETNDWFPPAGITILHASCNNEQVIIGLLNREICYFEVDSTDNQLIEYQDRLEMPGGVISSVSLSTSPKSSYAVVACSDSTITVISLEPHNCLGIVTLQALSSNCKSMIMLGHELHIGLDNGLYVRTQLDRTGNLSDTRTRYLGSKLIKLSTIGLLNGEDEELISGLLAISSKTWISYHYQERHKLTPLIDTRINSGASFYSEDIGGEGIVGINEEDELVIFTLGDGESTVSLDEDFTISSIKLRYTPTRLVKDVETDDSSLSLVYFIGSQIVDTSATPSVLEPGKPVPDVETDEESISIPHSSSPGWSSCLQVADISAQEIIQTVEFPKHEKAISLAIVRFEKHSENDYLVIGTTISTSPAKHYVYTFKRASTALEFVYKTEVDLPPTSLISFQGKLLIGMSNYLRLYELGQRQLLRKASTMIDHIKHIVKLSVLDTDRLAIGDLHTSITFIKYDHIDNKFTPFSDDIMKRHITSVAKLDRNTVIGGDKFGNIFVSRIPHNTSARVDEDWIIMKYQPPYLNGSGTRLKSLCEYHLGDIPTSFNVGSLNIGGIDSVIYTGLQGSLGIFLPLGTTQEIEFFQKLESLLREHFDYNFDDLKQKGNNILGRDHLKWRSYYNPVKNVVDGDLIERFASLPATSKVKISNKLDRTPKDIERKIADLRNRSAF